MYRIFPILGLAVLFSAALITLAITGEADVAKDPVCGMEVNPAEAAFHLDTEKGTVYFCSQYCLEKYQADPAAYMIPSKTEEKEAKPTAKKGCGDCEGCASAAKAANPNPHASAAGCEGECGQTKVQAINEFHKIMSPIEEALHKGDDNALKAAVADLVSGKNAVMEASCPDGISQESFEKARAEFGVKVDALAAAAATDDKEALNKAFQEMHAAYVVLDTSAR